MKPEDIEKIVKDATKQYENELEGEVEFIEPITVIKTTPTYFEVIIRKYAMIKNEIKKLLIKIFKNTNKSSNIRKDATVRPVTDNQFPEGYTMMTD